jgi:hypothetical protein
LTDGVLLITLPGARSGEIDIRFEDGELTIHAPATTRQTADESYLLMEYGVGDFYRTFRVSEQIHRSFKRRSINLGFRQQLPLADLKTSFHRQVLQETRFPPKRLVLYDPAPTSGKSLTSTRRGVRKRSNVAMCSCT